MEALDQLLELGPGTRLLSSRMIRPDLVATGRTPEEARAKLQAMLEARQLAERVQGNNSRSLPKLPVRRRLGPLLRMARSQMPRR